MPTKMLRVVMIQDGEWWVGQCLEHDIASQARSLRELQVEMLRVICAHVELHRQEGLDPFERVRPAPRRFHDLFEKGGRYEAPPFADSSMSSKFVPPSPEFRVYA